MDLIGADDFDVARLACAEMGMSANIRGDSGVNAVSGNVAHATRSRDSVDRGACGNRKNAECEQSDLNRTLHGSNENKLSHRANYEWRSSA